MSYTPQRLADKILTSRAMLEGERKQVSVLFADIKDSMELLTARDPEVAQTLLLDPVLERMIDAVHRYEGTVHRIMGDGIMALFGAPLALEDHAVRACYAALRMQETVKHYAGKVQLSHGVPLAIRVGLNSGEIVISAIGDDLQMDYTVVGQTAHLASRMEQIARAGSVLTTANTQHLAEGYIEMKPLGPMPVKGLADLIPIYEVMGAGSARTRLQTAAQRGLTRFVGRDVELEKLRCALQLAHGGHGQVVAIIGEAGVGKSRLVHEFVHSRHTADWLILETGSTSYSRATPYLPFIELLRRYFKINVHDKTESTVEKVTSRIVALDQSLMDAVPPLLDLLDSLYDKDPFRSLDPLQRAQCMSQALIRLLLSESRVQPLIAVFEDLHFNDSVTTGLLNELVVRAKNERVLLVASCRPEFTDLWGSWPSYHELRLEPLTRDRLADFNQALLGSDPSLHTLKGFLAERASGNPFFVEEIVRSLVDIRVLEGARGSYRIERPFLSVDVPPTVQSVLAARVDALPMADKRLLMEAAVIGLDVPFSLLHAICGLTEDRLRSVLDTLQAAEFLYATQIFPDLQYTFKHYLTHEVTYNGVLRERRREIHRRVVDAIENLHDGRLGEHVDRLAHHAVQGELHEKAVHYLRQAGRRAAARSALSDTRACFEQALNVLTALPESQTVLGLAFEIHLELRSVLRQLGEVRQMLEHLREAEAIAEQLEDDRRRCEVCAFSTNIQSTLGELDAALETGARALEIAERLGDPRLRIVTISALEQAYHYRGEYVRVAESAPGTQKNPRPTMQSNSGVALVADY
jgi:class 3 adenylate cyclase/tetratricopeptide (TPR) repeat protein